MDIKRILRGPIVWIGVAILVALLAGQFISSASAPKKVDTSAIIASITKGDAKSATIVDREQRIEIVLKNGDKKQSEYVTGQGVELQQLLQTKVDGGQLSGGYNIKVPKDNVLISLLATLLPIAIIVFLLFFFMNQVQGGGSKVMNFGKSKAKMMSKDTPQTTFADVAGADEAIEELEEIRDFLTDPARYQAVGAKIPKGVLLYGPPGTGKTLLARAVAGEAGVPFYTISGSDFVEMFVGVGASRVRDLFEQAKENAPAIIFIDEIDAVGRHRGAGMGGGHDEREQTLNQLLVEMDGFESSEGVIIIAATNRPDVLDPAILRPGRFDRRIVVPRPDVSGREAIFRVHTRKVPLAADVDIEVLARMTPGMAGADIENLVNESALIAARRDGNKVIMADFEAARDKIIMGNERRSMVMTAKEVEATAYHEAGHALVGLLLGEDEQGGKHGDFLPLHKVTIIPRGVALGVTSFMPDDRKSMNKRFAENRIAMAMGGRIAEELLFGDINSGAASDIDSATDLAKAMVTEWGMSEKLGPLSFGAKQGEVFLGRDLGQQANYSEQTAQTIDGEVHAIVMSQYRRARGLLEKNLDRLTAIAKALLEYETLDGADLKVLMHGGTISRTLPSIRIKTREQIDDERGRRDTASPGLILGGPTPEPAT